MRDRLLVAAWVLVLTACAFVLNTRHNQFPYFYHPDEPGKVAQIITGEWNFHHPMLLLSTTKVATGLLGTPLKEQAIVGVGRGVSAAFSAVSIAALALLAYFWRGWWASLPTGGALLFHHQIYELSHYMKEDTALLMGTSLTFLAAYVYWQRASLVLALAVGASCALATSGKYMGAMMLPLAVFVLLKGPGAKPRAHLPIFVGAFLAVMALVNAPILADFATFRSSFDHEVELVVRGQGGMTRSIPHAQYWNIFIDNTTPAIWVALLVFLVACWRRRTLPSSLEWVIIAFPFAFALALSVSPKSNDRYFLVATAIFTLLAGLAIVDIGRSPWLRRLRPQVAMTFAAALLVLCQLPSWMDYERAFQSDDTGDLVEWLRTKVPATAVITKDSRVLLPIPERKSHGARVGIIPQKVITKPLSNPEGKRVRYAADVGSLDELRAAGITHVAISQSDYGRFFLASLKPQSGEETDYNRRQRFYEELRARTDALVFERKRNTVIYLHPGIEVYQIAP